MFSQSTESSELILPPNRVISNKDQSIDNISQRLTNINMSDTRNNSLPDTQPNTPEQPNDEKLNQSSADTVANTQPFTVDGNSSSLLTSDDSDSSRHSVLHESAYLFNFASGKKSPAINVSTPKSLPNTSKHESSESRSKNGPDQNALANASPISLSSDSEDNGNVDDSGLTDDTSTSDVIEILSSDDEAEKDFSRVVSTSNMQEGEISETVVQKLNHFFDNIPISTSVNSLAKNLNLGNDDEINSHKASEIIVSESNESNNDVIHLDDSCGNLAPKQATYENEENNKTVNSHSSALIGSLDESNESAIKHDIPQNDSVLKTLESQLSSLRIRSPKINISARININIQLSTSSTDTDSSSEHTNSSRQKDATENSESKERTVSESSFEQDEFRKIDTDTHATGSHGSEIESIPNTETKNCQIDETRNEMSLLDTSSVIDSSQVGSAKKIFSSFHSNDDSKEDLSSAAPNPKQVAHTGLSKSPHESNDASPNKSQASNSSTPAENDSANDSLPEITEVGQKILNKLYGDTWKTPQLVKKCQPVPSKYFTDIPKLNNTHDFSLFERQLSTDLESTRITPAPSNEGIIKKRTEESQKTSNHLTTTKSTGCAGQSDSIDNKHEDSSRILRSGRKVPINRILDFSSDEDELNDNDDDYSDDSFKPSDEELNNKRCEGEPKATSKPISKPKSTSKRKKKSELVYLDLTHHEVIEDEEHVNPDASNEDLEAISSKFLTSLEYKTAVQTPMPKKQPNLSTPSRRKLFTPNYDNETPFEDVNTPYLTNVDHKIVELKTPIPTYLIPPQFRKLGRINENDDDDITNTTPISAPKPIYRLKTPLVSSSASSKICGFLESLNAKLIPERYCHPDALRLRSNFKQYRNELTDRLFKIYNDNVFANQLDDIAVTWNKTLRKTAGICKYRRKGANRTCTVELSEKVITESDRLRDTFIHELCHAAAWVLDGATGHGNGWKKWTKRAMERLPELPEIKVCHNYGIEYKYTYKCTICGLKSQAHSKSKKIENIRCSRCHGSIEVYLNKKDKDGKITLVPPKEASGFAKFVKENYKLHKVPGSAHANIMKQLGSEFSKLTVEEKLKY